MADQPPGRRELLRERGGSPVIAIQKHLHDLESDDFLVRSESIAELEKLGQPAAEAIVDSLLKGPSRLDRLTSYSDALEEIGRPSVNVIIHALRDIDDVRRPEHAALIENLVETLARIGGRGVVRHVTDQLGKLDRAIRRNHNRILVDCCEAAKVRIHRQLGELGAKQALEDLLAMLGDGRRRVRSGIVEAVEQLGDRRALVPLLRLHRLEESVSFSGALTIKGAFREIARREKIGGPDHPVFKELTPEERATLEKLLPKKH